MQHDGCSDGAEQEEEEEVAGDGKLFRKFRINATRARALCLSVRQQRLTTLVFGAQINRTILRESRFFLAGRFLRHSSIHTRHVFSCIIRVQRV